MKKEDIKENTIVVDRWFRELGSGRITNVKKTVFTVVFPNQSIKYDYPHAQFLDVCK